jgi:hypothetical protein
MNGNKLHKINATKKLKSMNSLKDKLLQTTAGISCLRPLAPWQNEKSKHWQIIFKISAIALKAIALLQFLRSRALQQF